MAGKMKAALRRYLVKALNLNPIPERGWYPIISESFLGAFQQDVTVRAEVALSHPTVYACVTQIASDIGKLRLRLTKFQKGIWQETINEKFSPILKKPNKYQTRQKFIENWILSKIIHGNTYVLKVRDARGNVTALRVLDPLKVTPLISESGMVFYKLAKDNLAGIKDDITAAPAYEIIHDTMECLYHPLIGIPPLYAASLATLQGLNIQSSSTKFFGNNSNPGGILTAPGAISDETAGRMKTNWETNFTGDNAGKVAVLGDGLTYEPLSVTASDSKLIEQLRWSDEKICSVYKVPPYKVYVGPTPTYQNVEILDRIYYAGCLQRHIEAIEQLLDEGLDLPDELGAEFNLDDLMRMDTALRMKTQGEGVKAGIVSPDEARSKFNLPPVPGGKFPYLQQQNYSLEALAKRDATNPLALPPTPPPTPEPEEPEPEEPDADDEAAKLAVALRSKGIEELLHETLR